MYLEPVLQKKKRRRRRRHRLSNCGTKADPKRMSETLIEYQHQGKVIVQGGRKLRKHREKRSISSPRHVEALVVADPSMVEFHEDNVETYLLTIMNLVSTLYKDPTIGNSIQVVIVRMIILEEDELHDTLNITEAAGTTLDSFCKWQNTMNPSEDDDPLHHDVAILVTRKDICANSGCSTLGVANVGGMCKPDRACSVNEDSGITLAHTITHEIGHNFGMVHDTVKTGCENRNGRILHIMTPSFEADTVHVSWSNCSRRDITRFLDQGLGSCLEDSPLEDSVYEYPDLPAGAMYDADHQCRLQFNSTDETIVVCSKPEEICQTLWCTTSEGCITKLRPAASGTKCGHHKWCQDQHCVEMDDPPVKIDGGWGNWSDWSECTRTCGAGIQSQVRFCDHPSPANGGEYCVGERARYKVCNTDPCPEGEQSFRALQCASHDNDTVKGQQYTWLPYFDSHEPCELYCTDVEDTVIIPFGQFAADGTPCRIGTNDMCIGGICRKVGCDWVVDSNTTEDQCGVCGGNGETCETITGEFSKKVNISEGYYEVLTIPSGSRHIVIKESKASKNYIAVSNTHTKEFYLNGNNLILISGEYEIAGSLGLYEREHELENLTIPGPTKEDITIHIVLKGKHKNIGLKYEYTLPTIQTKEPKYYWKLGEWTVCSSTCNGGKKYRLPICYEKDQGIVSDEKCKEFAENRRPEKITKSCNDIPCPSPHWWVGPWQLCSVTCHKFGDPDPIRRRSIMCVDQNEIALPTAQCNDQARPKETDTCNVPLCNTTEDTPNDMLEIDNNSNAIESNNDSNESYSEISNVIE
uniref:CSON001890 protein n=1 Tax=Culicoides sonorensis TaxID=179676 RepID=A0A336MHP1_CULSO